MHQCQGHEIAPDAAWLWVHVQEIIISNNTDKNINTVCATILLTWLFLGGLPGSNTISVPCVSPAEETVSSSYTAKKTIKIYEYQSCGSWNIRTLDNKYFDSRLPITTPMTNPQTPIPTFLLPFLSQQQVCFCSNSTQHFKVCMKCFYTLETLRFSRLYDHNISLVAIYAVT